MNGWVVFWVMFFVVVIGCWELLSRLFLFLTDRLFDKIPFMCEKCGHTFTDDEDPNERCPVCNSY